MAVDILAPDHGEFAVNRAVARIGFAQRGEHVILFEARAFEALPLTDGDIVVGGIRYAHRAMVRLGIPVPALSSIPQSLSGLAGRRIWTSTMGDARRRVQQGARIFVKPVPARYKLFGGQLLERFGDLIATARIDDDEPVICADPVAFVSEYRGFILRGALVGLRHYKGDPLIFPDPGVIRTALRMHASAPAGYAMDFGVTDAGETCVVEINDGYSSGAYGLSPRRYAAVIAARWDELRATAPPSAKNAAP